MTKRQPRYPVYVISKGRASCALTARFLLNDGVSFHLVIEPQEYDAYAKEYGAERIYTLPFSNLGLGGIPARNWVWEHAKASGVARHWILDDNIRLVYRRARTVRLPCDAGIALAVCEDFTERYENIAIAGMNYFKFAPDRQKMAPLVINCHVYSNFLIRNDLPYRWRGRYNEDTDLCLQVLAGGWCTVLLNTFLVDKTTTMKMKGGNTDELYKGDGRLKMARSLERQWPGVVSTKRRFQRPQHVVKDSWQRFDTPLIRRTDIDWDALTAPDEYGMKLTAVREVKSKRLQSLLEEANAHDDGSLPGE